MQAGAAKQRGCVPEKSRGRQLELEEAVAIVGKIASPAVESMFDTHNTVAEKLPHDELIRRHFRHICHVHLNEMDGRHPGVGDHDFGKVLQALKDLRYSGWMSVEVFDLKLGARTIAEQSVAFLRKLEAGLT
jgi:D-psicose/D-tagatose/L-ribulose 3-epimerase